MHRGIQQITLSHYQCIEWYATISKHLTQEAPLNLPYIVLALRLELVIA